ncbi:CD151 antigen isoform X2 [Ursus maritimus]|uniref:CD151 antigen isoform X2 n=1 Tax=Ursus maritimus TaxID=29073 RepID=A0A8M1GW46_URSMA|nr:CD151 antigen isoform X2 [Ursus maritimus]
MPSRLDCLWQGPQACAPGCPPYCTQRDLTPASDHASRFQFCRPCSLRVVPGFQGENQTRAGPGGGPGFGHTSPSPVPPSSEGVSPWLGCGRPRAAARPPPQSRADPQRRRRLMSPPRRLPCGALSGPAPRPPPWAGPAGRGRSASHSQAPAGGAVSALRAAAPRPPPPPPGRTLTRGRPDQNTGPGLSPPAAGSGLCLLWRPSRSGSVPAAATRRGDGILPSQRGPDL